eukprot:492400_1
MYQPTSPYPSATSMFPSTTNQPSMHQPTSPYPTYSSTVPSDPTTGNQPSVYSYQPSSPYPTATSMIPSTTNQPTLPYPTATSIIPSTGNQPSTPSYYPSGTSTAIPTPSKSPTMATKSPTTTPRLPFTLEHSVATVYELTMSWESNSITRSSGEDIHFPDPGPGNVVTITLRYNFDSTTTTLPGLYCNGCYRQVLFQVGDITRDCDGYSARSTASEAALTATYTSDGSAKNMSVAVDLQGACYQSSKIPNTYIGIIQNART